MQRTGPDENRSPRKSASEKVPKRRRGAATSSTTTTKPAAKPVAYHVPSRPNAYTAPATPRNDAAEK